MPVIPTNNRGVALSTGRPPRHGVVGTWVTQESASPPSRSQFAVLVKRVPFGLPLRWGGVFREKYRTGECEGTELKERKQVQLCHYGLRTCCVDHAVAVLPTLLRVGEDLCTPGQLCLPVRLVAACVAPVRSAEQFFGRQFVLKLGSLLRGLQLSQGVSTSPHWTPNALSVWSSCGRAVLILSSCDPDAADARVDRKSVV